MADDKIEIELILEDGSTVKAFKNVEKRATKSAKKIGSSFGSTLKSLRGPILALGGLFAGVFAGRAAIRAAAEAQQSIQDLTSSLQSAGTFSIETRNSILELADAIERTTTTSAEQFQSLVSLAQSYTTTAEAARDLAKASLDFAAGADITVTEAVRRLGRGVQGATGDIANFVPAIRELTKEQLKAGVATELLAKRFAGAAQREANTFDGALIKLGAALGGIPEAFGKVVTGSPGLIALFDILGKQANIVATSLESLGETDILGNLIINFSIIAQAGAESARQIGLSFELAFLRAQQAFFAFKVATTLGFSEAFNTDLDNVLIKIEETKLAFSETSAITEFFDNLILKVTEAGLAFDESGSKLKNFGKDVAVISKKAEFDVKTRIGQGISSAIQQTVSAIQNGEDAFAAFGKATISIFGDLAIQLGQFFIINGIAVEALKALGGAAAIAAGIALIALGTLLKGAGGGGGAVGQTAVGASPGGPADTGGVAPGDTLAEETADADELAEPKTIVNISIDGVVSDPTGVAQQINELLNDFADTNGGAIVNTV